MRDNFHAIRNQLSTSLDLDHLKGDESLVQDFSYPNLQPLNAFECQVQNKDLEARSYAQMMQDDSIPFCFKTF